MQRQTQTQRQRVAVNGTACGGNPTWARRLEGQSRGCSCVVAARDSGQRGNKWE